MIALKHVLVATDFSEASDAALLYGRTMAMKFGATLHVVHIADNVFTHAFGPESAGLLPTIQTDIEEAARRRLSELSIDSDRSGPPTRSMVLTASAPAFAIVDYATDNDIDLIVMGTHGRKGLQRVVLGSVAEKVVRMAPCPVLTIHHPEHEFVQPDALVALHRTGAVHKM
ncbi:MAG TPA: universal stress protein [Vicinamibacterales bacterium]|nr:universal stress protein [Vicinamibacterales bacterium]